MSILGNGCKNYAVCINSLSGQRKQFRFYNTRLPLKS